MGIVATRRRGGGDPQQTIPIPLCGFNIPCPVSVDLNGGGVNDFKFSLLYFRGPVLRKPIKKERCVRPIRGAEIFKRELKNVEIECAIEYIWDREGIVFHR
jgi:hypothetical protein